MPRRQLARLLLGWLLIAASSLAAASGVERLSGESMGTRWSVSVVLPASVQAAQAQSAVQAALDRVVAQMSTWDADSDISILNRAQAGWHAVPEPFFDVLRAAMALARDTQGAYDPTVLPLVDVWGFGAVKRPRHPPSDSELALARARVGWRKLRLDGDASRVHKENGVRLDLSSIAKGFGVDQAAKALDALGSTDYLVEVGGELRGRGRRPDGQAWHVAIEQPDSGPGESLAAVIALDNLSVATSGDYRRYFRSRGKTYSHIIDPRTGFPVTHTLASVTVVHPDCMHADALATALTVLGPEAGMDYARRHGLAALFIVATGRDFVSQTTPAFRALAEAE